MTTFKYSLISDMHVNHPQPKTPYDKLENNVIVAGDTSNGLEGLKFLRKLQNKGFNVFACDGNHEHYSNVSQGRSPKETTSRFREAFPMLTDIDETLSIVCTNGWYGVRNPLIWDQWQNDHKYIFGGKASVGAREMNLMALGEAEILYDLLDTFHDRKWIVVTHTSPCYETLDPKFEGAFSNEWYVNELMGRVLSAHNDKILVWNHGHTHARNEAVVNGVRVVCNPRGYPRENPDWVPMTISVEY